MNFLRKRLIKIASVRLLIPAIANLVKIARINAGQKKIVTALSQHLGDNIAAEPLDSDIKLKHPQAFIIRVVNKSFATVVDNNPNIDQLITVSCLSEWIYLKPLLNLFYKVYDYHIHKTFCNKYRLTVSNPNASGIHALNYYAHGNLLQVFCACCGHEALNVKPVYRLKPEVVVENLPVKFAVIHVVSNHDEREWMREKWLGLIEYFAQNNVEVIEVGLKSNLNCTLPNYHDYCGRLSMNEIAYTIKQASFFVGIDSAFAHFANAFNVPRLILLGHFNNFTYYLPYSGLSKAEEQKTVIHHSGPVKELPLETVIEKIEIY